MSPDEFGYLNPTGTLWSWPGQNPMRLADPMGHGIWYSDPRAPLVAFLVTVGLADAANVIIEHQNALDAIIKGDVAGAECSAGKILNASANLAAAAVTTALVGGVMRGGGSRGVPSRAIAARSVAGEGATIYRAVSAEELADIHAVGGYRVPAGGAEGKYFFGTPEQASNFARMMGDQPYTTTSVRVSPAELARAQPINPAREGAGYFFSTPDVPTGKVTTWNYSVVP